MSLTDTESIWNPAAPTPTPSEFCHCMWGFCGPKVPLGSTVTCHNSHNSHNSHNISRPLMPTKLTKSRSLWHLLTSGDIWWPLRPFPRSQEPFGKFTEWVEISPPEAGSRWLSEKRMRPADGEWCCLGQFGHFRGRTWMKMGLVQYMTIILAIEDDWSHYVESLW